MFKALQIPENTEINLLSRFWLEQIPDLRRLDRGDRLVCPGCRQPVRVRACVQKRKHFAHKHLQNCPLQLESPELLLARAVLYEALANQLGENNVVVEQTFAEVALPRPLDVWIQPAGQAWGYWIVDRRMPPDQRERLLKAFQQLPGAIHFIFIRSMLHPDEKDTRRLYLTTTEREFMVPTTCDAAWENVYALPGRTLHYLDAEKLELTTYRSLSLAHSPQLYAGHPLRHSLSQVQAISDEGGWLHPGEEQRIARHLHEAALRQQSEARLKEVSRRLRDGLGGWGKPATSARPAPTPHQPVDKWPKFDPEQIPPLADANPRMPFQRSAVCRVCGKTTADWVSYDGKNKTCLCRECAKDLTPGLFSGGEGEGE